MSKTIACEFLMLAAALLQPWMVLSQGENSCNAEVRATTSPQNIVSENFPNHYPNDINCRTHITSPEGTVIELHFYVFSLEDSTDCEKDALVVFDGIDGGTRLLQHSCGSDFVWPHYPDKVVSTGNGMTLEFITDASGTSIGFSATYQAVKPRPFVFVIVNPDDQRLRVLHRHSARNFAISPVGIQFPLSVDYDPISGFIFYSDKNAYNIGKVHIESLQSKILHSKSIFYPIGLRVDVVSRLLYWTDAIQSTVSVSDLDGNYRLTIIENAGLSRPGSIVNEPNRGYIYFTDQGSRGKIWKAEADGSNLRTLVNKTNFHPQGLAIDLQERCLYWVDTIASELQMITVDGTNSSSFRLYDGVDPFAIALDEAAIFFTDESLRFYERSLQMDGRGIVFVDVSDYRGLTLRPLYDFGEDDPYACSSSPCEEICLPKPSDLFICQKVMPEFVKICPDDLIINGTSSVSVTWNEPAVTSPRGLSVTHTQTHHPGENFDPGAHLVNYDFEDIVGNKVSCAFYVVVIEPLGIFCPDDVEVFVDEDDDHGIATWHEPVNSFGERAVTQTHTPGDPFPLGQTIVNYVFEDSTYSCSFIVTITQYRHPTDVFENCPDPILKWVAPHQTSTTVTWDTIQVENDNYNIVLRTEIPGSRFYVGTEKVSVLAIGPSNHRAWCNFTVTVQVDNEPPEITGCPSTIRRVASEGSTFVEVTWIEPTVSDNSGSVYWESKPAEPGSPFSVGTSDLTYVASDGFGNKATCSFQIVISESGVDPSAPPPTGQPFVIPLLIAIPCIILTLIVVTIVIQRHRRKRRRTNNGRPLSSVYSQQIVPPQPMVVSGGQLTFISGRAVNFQASPGLDNTYDVIDDNRTGALGPPPPYREKY